MPAVTSHAPILRGWLFLILILRGNIGPIACLLACLLAGRVGYRGKTLRPLCTALRYACVRVRFEICCFGLTGGPHLFLSARLGAERFPPLPARRWRPRLLRSPISSSAQTRESGSPISLSLSLSRSLICSMTGNRALICIIVHEATSEVQQLAAMPAVSCCAAFG